MNDWQIDRDAVFTTIRRLAIEAIARLRAQERAARVAKVAARPASHATSVDPSASLPRNVYEGRRAPSVNLSMKNLLPIVHLSLNNLLPKQREHRMKTLLQRQRVKGSSKKLCCSQGN